jgi:hypothetical protein
MRWLLSKGGQVVGPVEASVVQLWAHEGKVQPGTLICQEGAHQWGPFEHSMFAEKPKRVWHIGPFIIMGLVVLFGGWIFYFLLSLFVR